MQATIESGTKASWLRVRDRYLGAAMIAASVVVVLAGLLHPEDSPVGMLEPIWGPLHTAFFFGLFVTLIGIFRVYGLISADSGWLGAGALVLFALGVVGFEGVMILEVGVFPVLAASEATRPLLGETSALFAGPLGMWLIGIALVFSVGAILFAISLFRARTLPRWAGPLLVVAPLFALSPPLPLWLAKVGLVVFFGGGIAGLGWGLWKWPNGTTDLILESVNRREIA